MFFIHRWRAKRLNLEFKDDKDFDLDDTHLPDITLNESNIYHTDNFKKHGLNEYVHKENKSDSSTSCAHNGSYLNSPNGSYFNSPKSLDSIICSYDRDGKYTTALMTISRSDSPLLPTENIFNSTSDLNQSSLLRPKNVPPNYSNHKANNKTTRDNCLNSTNKLKNKDFSKVTLAHPVKLRANDADRKFRSPSSSSSSYVDPFFLHSLKDNNFQSLSKLRANSNAYSSTSDNYVSDVEKNSGPSGYQEGTSLKNFPGFLNISHPTHEEAFNKTAENSHEYLSSEFKQGLAFPDNIPTNHIQGLQKHEFYKADIDLCNYRNKNSSENFHLSLDRNKVIDSELTPGFPNSQGLNDFFKDDIQSQSDRNTITLPMLSINDTELFQKTPQTVTKSRQYDYEHDLVLPADI